MAVADIHEIRGFGAANILGVRTPTAKRTPRWKIDQARRLSFDRAELTLLVNVMPGQTIE